MASSNAAVVRRCSAIRNATTPPASVSTSASGAIVVPGSTGGTKLPLTGVALPVLGGLGVALVMIGLGLFLWNRRRDRAEFVAE